MTAVLSPEALGAVKEKQQATWASGDYAVIGTSLQIVGETLCEAVDVQAGWKVLDVAAGNGNASLAAARRGCEVTASDYVEALLEGTARRAEGEGLRVERRVADAEALPFDDGGFDAVLSTFGVMFTPDHERAGAELVRVCRPGGRIGLACWTPEGVVGEVLRTVAAHVPPPAGVPSPLLWGTVEHLGEVLPGCQLEVRERAFTFRYRSAQHWFETFRDFYGPVHKAWTVLDEAGRASLERELVALLEGANRAGSSSLCVDAAYLEVVATTSRATGRARSRQATRSPS
jgi:ubiquinone/menaquinone biosynthesis C-methylase UbiE